MPDIQLCLLEIWSLRFLFLFEGKSLLRNLEYYNDFEGLIHIQKNLHGFHWLKKSNLWDILRL